MRNNTFVRYGLQKFPKWLTKTMVNILQALYEIAYKLFKS